MATKFGAKRTTYSSSSSEDEEEKARLRDAVAGSSAVVSLSNNGGSVATLKSARRGEDRDEDEEFDQLCTPAFRQHVAKKLTAFLDGSIKVSSSKGRDSTPAQTSDDGGYRLFSDSTPARAADFRLHPEAESPTASRKRQRRPVVSSSSSDDEEYNRLAMAAVSGQMILNDGGLRAGKADAETKGSVEHEKRPHKHSKRKKNQEQSLLDSDEDEDDCEGRKKKLKKKKEKKKKKNNKEESDED